MMREKQKEIIYKKFKKNEYSNKKTNDVCEPIEQLKMKVKYFIY